jgi:NAD(P)-dependent dehydrogenase (short-subunit alcohol dehydrogenase family)
VLACRSAERARAVIEQVEAAPGPAHAVAVSLDLADLASVRACAAAVVAGGEPIHVLINNAGVAGVRGATAQGFELGFGVNHLGHFLLTRLLLDGLGDRAPGRVVNLASKAHHGAKGLDWDALQRPTRTRTGLVEYQVAKLCNVLFTRELARRGTETVAVHPGVIASGIWRPVPWPLRPLATRFMGTPEAGARATLRWASGALGVQSGSYIDVDREAEPSPLVTDELAAGLWRRSEAWTS